MKVSCVCNTYARFACVNRSVRFFLNQDACIEKELIIYNTDIDYPIILSSTLPTNIKVVNNNIDSITKCPYINLGSVRRDSLQHASGQYYICWDDDDIFLPWHIRQCLDGIHKYPHAWAWKPFTSMFWKCGCAPELAWNNMEASIIVDLMQLKQYGFDMHQGGGEHLGWMSNFQKQRRLIIDRNSIPSYCFNWHDQGKIRGHKQSGTINRIDNFEFHKKNTTDHAMQELTADVPVTSIYMEHVDCIKRNIGVVQKNKYTIPVELLAQYI